MFRRPEPGPQNVSDDREMGTREMGAKWGRREMGTRNGDGAPVDAKWGRNGDDEMGTGLQSRGGGKRTREMGTGLQSTRNAKWGRGSSRGGNGDGAPVEGRGETYGNLGCKSSTGKTKGAERSVCR